MTELQNQANNVTSATTKTYFELTQNIDMGATNILISGGRNYEFDGKGYTISNYRSVTSIWGAGMGGLFGLITNSTIKNLTVSNFTVQSNADAGSLVGYTSGTCTIENCHAFNGDVIGKRVGIQMYDGREIVWVYAEPARIGGLVGCIGTNSKLIIRECSLGKNVTVRSYWADTNTVSTTRNTRLDAGDLLGK